MGKQAPPPGDYKGAAEQTAASSQQNTNQQTQANRPNVSTPFGSQQWTRGPNGEWQMTAGLSPEVQAAFQNMTPFSLSSLPAAMSGDQAREQAIKSAWDSSLSRLEPMWNQRESALQTQLANQGLDPNSQAARNATRQSSAARNDAYSQAMAGAIAQGTAAGDSAFRNNLMNRQNAMAEALRARQLPMDDLRGLMGFMQTPGFNQAGRADATNYLQALMAGDQAALQRWQASNEANSDLAGGIMQGLGSLAQLGMFAFSDERMKRDVVRLEAEAMPGVPFAEWTWLDGSPGFGVIAQDVAAVAPERVAVHPSGFLMVDYSFLVR